MENALVISKEVAVMALIATFGYILVKTGLIAASSSKSFSNLLLFYVTPSVIINSLQREYRAEEARLFFIMAALSLACFAILILLSALIYRRRKGCFTGGMRMAAVLNNAGYMGIPLVQAVLGKDGVFLLTAFFVCFQLVMFSYGRYELQKDGAEVGGYPHPVKPDITMLRQFLLTPTTLTIFAGVLLYVLNIRLPPLVLRMTESVSALNSVVSMLLIGLFLAQSDLKSVLLFPRGYGVAAVRLLLGPAVAIALLWVLPLPELLGASGAMLTATTLVILSSTPCAVAAAFMPELYGANSLYGTRYVIISTLISLVTMPLTFVAWQLIAPALGY